MKNRYLLIILIGIIAATGYATKRVPSTKPLCSEGICGTHTQKCSCYCSVLCGPRKIQPDDNPRFVTEDEAAERGIKSQCYCKQMDVENYAILKEDGRICKEVDLGNQE